MKVLHTYEKFNTNAAEEIIPYILEHAHPSSVIDVGCGIGTWLSTYKKYGVETILGLDGQHVLTDRILIDKDLFVPVDLSDINEISKLELTRFDLVNCLEVAEHLPEKHAPQFVDFLTSLTDIIVFSASIPGQLGQNHMNEQFPDYWQNLFAKKGFVFLDAFRRQFWTNKRVDWWYRQNMFFVVKEKIAEQFPFDEWDGSVWVIPELFNMYVETFDTRNKERFIAPHLSNSEPGSACKIHGNSILSKLKRMLS